MSSLWQDQYAGLLRLWRRLPLGRCGAGAVRPLAYWASDGIAVQAAHAA